MMDRFLDMSVLTLLVWIGLILSPVIVAVVIHNIRSALESDDKVDGG